MASKKSGKVTAMTGRRRMVFFFVVVVVLFVLITARTGYIQIVKADEYSAMALEKQTKDFTIEARRGTIYDTNMKALAINQSTSTIWVHTDIVAEKEKNDPGYTKTMADTLSRILGDKTSDEVYKILTSDSKCLKVAKFVDDERTEKIREATKATKDPETGDKIPAKLAGLDIYDTPHRYYPMGEFASHVIGTTNDDNEGMSGIELYYDQYLTGTEGRWIRSTDRAGRSLTNGVEKYYSAEDGCSVVLTIDEIIQHYVENALKQVQADTQALRTMAIVMDPKTGDILAMASYPDYDLNDPRALVKEEDQEMFNGLTDEEKVQYWSDIWRNPLVNDTYEPGSPFKLLTTCMALEEGLTNVNDTFVCRPIQLYDKELKCWKSSGSHGTETLGQGVANSCNPVFVTLSQRLGITRFYSYLDAYGFTGTTGLDYPGEATAILQDKNTVGPVGLATSSYGQGLACTPIQLITALSSIGNEGKVMRPRLVRGLADSNGKMIEEFDPVTVRQVVSKQSADEVCVMMEGVVNGGTGSAAYIPGYRIGGKTGTAQKVVNGKYTEDTYSSFFAMAPMDDPQISILFIVDSPQGVHFGSKTAGPGIRMVLEDTLQYLGVEPVYADAASNGSSSVTKTVPDLTGRSYETAAEILDDMGLTAISCPVGAAGFEVVDQYPKPGATISGGGSVCLYQE